MSKLDGRTLWRIIDRAQKRNEAQFERAMVAGGPDADGFVGEAFAEWAEAAQPEAIASALQQIAKAGTPGDKRLKALSIAGLWE